MEVYNQACSDETKWSSWIGWVVADLDIYPTTQYGSRSIITGHIYLNVSSYNRVGPSESADPKATLTVVFVHEIQIWTPLVGSRNLKNSVWQPTCWGLWRVDQLIYTSNVTSADGAEAQQLCRQKGSIVKVSNIVHARQMSPLRAY